MMNKSSTNIPSEAWFYTREHMFFFFFFLYDKLLLNLLHCNYRSKSEHIKCHCLQKANYSKLTVRFKWCFLIVLVARIRKPSKNCIKIATIWPKEMYHLSKCINYMRETWWRKESKIIVRFIDCVISSDVKQTHVDSHVFILIVLRFQIWIFCLTTITVFSMNCAWKCFQRWVYFLMEFWLVFHIISSQLKSKITTIGLTSIIVLSSIMSSILPCRST